WHSTVISYCKLKIDAGRGTGSGITGTAKGPDFATRAQSRSDGPMVARPFKDLFAIDSTVATRLNYSALGCRFPALKGRATIASSLRDSILHGFEQGRREAGNIRTNGVRRVVECTPGSKQVVSRIIGLVIHKPHATPS